MEKHLSVQMPNKALIAAATPAGEAGSFEFFLCKIYTRRNPATWCLAGN